MKKLFGLILMMSACSISSNAAVVMSASTENGVEDHFLTVLTDSAFNSMQNALYVGPDNELLVGNLGVDMYAVANAKNGLQIIYPDANRKNPLTIKNVGSKHDSIVIPVTHSGTIDFQGREYPMIVRVTHSKPTQYVSLSRIAEELGLDEKEQKSCLYMINERIIIDNADAYKVDKNFILKEELESSKNIHSLKNIHEFHIVRIYTKTHRNNEMESSVRIR